ncbi:MAG: GNVR domain-containing protein [Terriglobales bacterium]
MAAVTGLRHRPLTGADVAELVRRRWAWVLVPALLIAGGGIVAVRHLPKLYQSEAMILVEPQRVPTDFVKPTVNEDTDQLLVEISEEILSRTHLLALIQHYGLYPRLRDRLSERQLAERMRQDITVKNITRQAQQTPGQQGGAFQIAYQGTTPRQAQQVTQDLAGLFIAENLAVRQRQAQGTVQFITTELGRARRQLQSQSAQQAALQRQFMGALPEQEASNLQQLTGEQTALEAAEQQAARDQQQKTYLQSLQAALAGTPAPAAAPTTPLAAQLQADQLQLAALEQVDTPKHPDVVRLKGEIAALRRQQAADPPPAAAAPGPSGLSAQQIRGELATLDQDARWQRGQEQSITAKIAQLRAQLAMEPAVQERLAAVERNYKIATANYELLLKNRDAADMAAAMEEQAEGEEFRVVDPANLPQRPDKPQIAKLSLLAVVLGLLVGVGLGVGRDYSDPAVRNERDVEYYLGATVLAQVPLVRSQAERRRAGQRLALGVLTAVVVAGIGAAAYWHGAAWLARMGR